MMAGVAFTSQHATTDTHTIRNTHVQWHELLLLFTVVCRTELTTVTGRPNKVATQIPQIQKIAPHDGRFAKVRT